MDRRLDTLLAHLSPKQPEAIDSAAPMPDESVLLARQKTTTLDELADERGRPSHAPVAREVRERKRLQRREEPSAQRLDVCAESAAVSDSRPLQPPLPPQPPTSTRFIVERRRLERDLHDGVQNELVALIVSVAVAQERADITPALAEVLGGLAARAEAALKAVREISHGIYPRVLKEFGLREALRGQTCRAAIEVFLVGTAPRSSEEVEEAAYFACSEAIQNAAKHAGRGARVTLRVRHDRGTLSVHMEDDGRGFDPRRTPEGAGLRNIRGRIREFGGTFRVASKPGCGTVLTISLPWPATAGQAE